MTTLFFLNSIHFGPNFLMKIARQYTNISKDNLNARNHLAIKWPFDTLPFAKSHNALYDLKNLMAVHVPTDLARINETKVEYKYNPNFDLLKCDAIKNIFSHNARSQLFYYVCEKPSIDNTYGKILIAYVCNHTPILMLNGLITSRYSHTPKYHDHTFKITSLTIGLKPKNKTTPYIHKASKHKSNPKITDTILRSYYYASKTNPCSYEAAHVLYDRILISYMANRIVNHTLNHTFKLFDQHKIGSRTYDLKLLHIQSYVQIRSYDRTYIANHLINHTFKHTLKLFDQHKIGSRTYDLKLYTASHIQSYVQIRSYDRSYMANHLINHTFKHTFKLLDQHLIRSRSYTLAYTKPNIYQPQKH
jgi:hypothetical protein